MPTSAVRGRFLVAQCFAIAFVACDNQSRSSAHAKTSIAAKCFGAFDEFNFRVGMTEEVVSGGHVKEMAIFFTY
jgi:hypothetical protein